MSDRKASYPTAPIAWMSQAYEATPTNSTPSSPAHSHSRQIQTVNPSNARASLER